MEKIGCVSMVVKYVPINPDNIRMLIIQKLYLAKMIREGWDHLGHVKLKDESGTDVTVAVLKNDRIDLKS